MKDPLKLNILLLSSLLLFLTDKSNWDQDLIYKGDQAKRSAAHGKYQQERKKVQAVNYKLL